MAERAGPQHSPPGRRRLISAWLPVLLVEAAVVYWSSRPHLRLPAAVPHLDKAAHFAEYFVLGWLLRRALAATLPGGRGALVLAVVLVAFLGAGDELLQSSVPGRDPSLVDWLGDLMGGAVGAVAVSLAVRRGAGAAFRGGETERAEG